MLVQYNERLLVTLVCDASPYRVGAMLSHKMLNGIEAHIAYFSQMLSAAERNYGQIDMEALAAVAGFKCFHDYLYGRPFELIMDHQPLLGLLESNKQTLQYLSPHMSRWAVFLAAYNYTLTYPPGKTIGHMDASATAYFHGLLKTLPWQSPFS